MTSNQEMEALYFEWKNKYTEDLVEHLKPFGDVLQVGFTPKAADSIQACTPKSHTIIEEEISDEFSNWIKKHPDVIIIHDKWQNALSNLKDFDSIFFNYYLQEDVINTVELLFCEEIVKSQEKAKKVLSEAEEAIAKVKAHYSDEEIGEFYEKTGRLTPKELPSFFLQLRANGNISESQYNNAYKRYNIGNIEKGIYEEAPKEVVKQVDPMTLFLEACIKNHMRRGGRFSAYLNGRVSKYENTDFFDRIITNPMIDYEEVLFPVALSDRPRNALFILVTKH